MENIDDDEKNSSRHQIAGNEDMATNNVADNPAMQTQETMEDPLDKCPPDFAWARKHREANMVKNLEMRNLTVKDVQNEDLY
jgi:hypothetical protein